MARKLIILTSVGSLFAVNEKTEDFENFESLETSGYLKFDNKILSKIEAFSEAEIIFVADRDRQEEDYETCQAWWDKFVTDNKADDDEWYVIYHTRGIQPAEQAGIRCVQGMHTKNPKDSYRRVARILLDSEINNKKDKIIEKIFGVGI